MRCKRNGRRSPERMCQLRDRLNQSASGMSRSSGLLLLESTPSNTTAKSRSRISFVQFIRGALMKKKDLLDKYQKKRDFNETPEPSGKPVKTAKRSKQPMFVIQKHDATRLH